MAAEDWPGWRGPRGDGTSEESGVPTAWDGPSGENVAWQVPIAGSGHSSPIVWGDRIFLVTCIEKDNESQRVLLALDRKTGETVWQKTVLAAPLEKKHQLNRYASGTPATDGQLVYCTFLAPDVGGNKDRTPGDMVVAAYDLVVLLNVTAACGPSAKRGRDSRSGRCSK